MKPLTRTMFSTLALSVVSLCACASPGDLTDISVGLLERGLEQGDRAYIEAHVAEDYIQHNPIAEDGRAGLLGYADYLSTLDNVEISPVRVLVDGDMVAIHSQYSTTTDSVVFDVFRFDGKTAVEHWDGTQNLVTDTVSGRSMLDGPTTVIEQDKTDINRQIAEDFVQTILIDGQSDRITDFIGAEYLQHNPGIGDGLDGLGAFQTSLAENNTSFSYSQRHHTVADGNFVLTISEGEIGGQPNAFYDLWRVEDGMLVEHWDVIQPIPKSMPHDNGMF